MLLIAAAIAAQLTGACFTVAAGVATGRSSLFGLSSVRLDVKKSRANISMPSSSSSSYSCHGRDALA